MRKVGLNVDMQVSDWGTMMQRVFKKEPIEQGGWSCLTYAVNGNDVWDPAMNNYLRSNGVNVRPPIGLVFRRRRYSCHDAYAAVKPSRSRLTS